MLYFVATPIGNLKDISLRALEILESVDIIACEDTRNSLKLLNHYNIKKKLIAYHKFNEDKSSDGIIALLKNGKNVAVISDSGTPVISDPGNILSAKLKEEEIDFTVIPGANAGLSAIILSGLKCDRFSFIGFLPENNKEKKKILDEIKSYTCTLIFYVAPHNVISDIKTLYENLGNRRACLCNEITKMYEKTYSFNLGDEITFEPKGEYVMVVEGNSITLKDDLCELSIKEHLLYYISLGEKKQDAVKIVAKERGLSKNEVYMVALEI